MPKTPEPPSNAREIIRMWTHEEVLALSVAARAYAAVLDVQDSVLPDSEVRKMESTLRDLAFELRTANSLRYQLQDEV